ncbi:MAG: B12-binding domain-containing radical SAM protein [Candidatus Thermoplasmatota archaeon]|nr:B12-binding domain-containing radical SAM protein [Candidatus Thermoplasmatota archaeon]MBU1941688.1 B12-binding domain-containing radical SAM protein [Candidatus Thermoplasmatota archaeon]
MKILIIENVWMGRHRYGFFDKTLLTAFSILPTMSARQLAAITPSEHQVTLVNERYTPIPYTQGFDLVNINFTTSTTPHAYQIANRFRTQGTPVVLSGMHASALPEEAVQHANAILLGRGELGWLHLLHDFQKGQMQQRYEPIPYTHETHLPPTNVKLPGFVMTGAVEATRGCPYACQFCPEVHIPGGSCYYKRPVADVIEEIKHLPQKTFQFYDSSLTIDVRYTKELFSQMKGLGKRFFCNGNVDTLAQDEELVALSKEAGCLAWLIGFESVSQPTLDAIGKRTNMVENYQKVVTLIHRYHMLVIGCFIFGFDTDTPQVFRETLHMINTLGIDVADFCALTPFPGTPIFQQLQKEKRLLTTNWEQYNLKTVVYKPFHMSPEELEQGLRFLYQEFYNPLFAVKRISKTLRFGLIPFGVMKARTLVAMMNSQKLSK